MEIKDKENIIIISSHKYLDTNATKARISAYMDVLKFKKKIYLICPSSKKYSSNKDFNLIEIGQNRFSKNFYFRAFFEILYAMKVCLKLMSFKQEKIIVTIPSMFLLLILLIRKNVVVDLRDLVWEYLNENNNTQKIIKKIIKKIMIFLLKKSKGIIVTNNAEKRYLKNELGDYEAFLLIIRNGINNDRFKLLSSLKLQNQSKNINIIYVGNVGYAQNLTTLVDALKDSTSIKAKIIGEGNDLQNVKNYALQSRVENIQFIDGLSWYELLFHYEKADILYAQILEQYNTAIPSKLYEYLSIGLPIIFAGKGESSSFLSQFENTMIINPNDSKELIFAINQHLGKKFISKSKYNMDKLKKQYIREVQVKKIINYI